MENQLEIWKDIPDYEGLYQVSNLGNVKSLSRSVIKNGKLLYTKKERLISFCYKKGYLGLTLFKEAKRKPYQVHQLVAMAFLNHKPNGFELVINHKDFNKLNNKLENLEIITQRENANQKHLPSTSKYTGVSLQKTSNKWRSTIWINKKKVFLGDFEDELKASECYQNALLEINNRYK